MKKAKNAHFAGDNFLSGRFAANAVIPGLQCVMETVKESFSSKVSSPSGQDEGIVQELSHLSGVVQDKRFPEVFSTATDYYNKSDSLAQNLKVYLRLLDENDSISMNISKNTAFFLGIAAAGTPFTGWFIGALARWGKEVSLTLTKSESGNIYFTFIRNTIRSLVALGGGHRTGFGR
ncbi:hypothetical protein ABK905_15295 [Acerihabitans sp. KWT182]|uniref:Uncharacterized protein n=1 Tax=Acerihabitans sp. KWT182 TaxID=3157919 RepID=A0AAU7Q4X6_9GAMM